MGYRWKKYHKGQYVDGHEQQDVVDYWQNIFLPAIEQYEHRMRTWMDDHGWDLPRGIDRAVVIWVHDESIFYAHDRRQTADRPHGTIRMKQPNRMPKEKEHH